MPGLLTGQLESRGRKLTDALPCGQLRPNGWPRQPERVPPLPIRLILRERCQRA